MDTEEIRILIIEDEKPIADILEYNFKKEGYQVESAHTGADGLSKVEDFKPQLLLLDWMLPDLSGVDVCKIVTERYKIPVIMLTARGSTDDKVYGLTCGADDYVTKPFEIREINARVKTVLRRLEKSRTSLSEKSEIHIKNLVISEKERTVRQDEAFIELTPKEFDLLVFFIKNPRQVFTRDQLLNEIWGYDFMGDTRTIDIHIQRLRKKLNLGEAIVTVFGVGYKYVSEES